MNKLLIALLVLIPSFANAESLNCLIAKATVNPYANYGVQQAYINQQCAIGALIGSFISGEAPTQQEIQSINNIQPQITTYTDAQGRTVTQAYYRMQNANSWHCEMR